MPRLGQLLEAGSLNRKKVPNEPLEILRRKSDSINVQIPAKLLETGDRNLEIVHGAPPIVFYPSTIYIEETDQIGDKQLKIKEISGK